MTVTYSMVGAVTQEAAEVRAKITGTSARLAVDTDPTFSSPTYTAAVTPTTDGIVVLPVNGLLPDTQYYWDVEDTGVLSVSWRGAFRTFPTVGSEASFSFAVSSCAGQTGATSPGEVVTSQQSNHKVFSAIRTSGVLWFSHIGDKDYRNYATNSVANFRTGWNDTLTYNGLGSGSLQGTLYRNIPWTYVWDDHDFGGDNSDRTAASNAAVNQVYRERMPSYELPSSGVYQSWQVGRVQVIQWDTRTFRDPNSEPDIEGHTMLGQVQLDWTQQILTSSTAEFLIILNPTPWLGTSNDKWGGFSLERDQLIEMFDSTGWSDRMIMVCGDRHALAIDSGVNNPGGFPTMLAGALDSYSNVVDRQYDRGFSPGRGRWMKVDVTDLGDQISITTTGMITTSVGSSYTTSSWNSYTTTVVVEQDPGPAPPAPSEARLQSRVTWLAVNLATREIVDELPDLMGSISRTLGEYTSSSLTTPLVTSGPASRRNILGSTSLANVAIVAIVNDRPTWAGTILSRQYGTQGTLELGVATLEGYLERRIVGQLGPYTNVDESSVIARNLLLQAGDKLGVGIGIGMLIDAPPTGTLRSIEYKLTDRKSVYDCLTELMDLDDGPEWTVDLEWTSSRMTSLEWIGRVRKRLGEASVTPHSVFEITAPSVFSAQGTSDASYQIREDFTSEHGANYVVAYSSGQDDAQPASSPVWDTETLGQGRPIFERHFQPATDIRVKAVLDSYATAELARSRQGAVSVDIKARWDAFPRINLDWGLGDDVGYDLTGHGHPNGIKGQGRLISWDLDLLAGTISLILEGRDG
ncbi:alkaline phosphatase D family protein [Phytomonospora sp. NPDC050363]|uniref:alkaline phosphatase D family protein n=1 Tax=Phytomonospora sp. NPDC050363 TaxID=3155642 RepID=UPI0033E1D14E